MILADAFSEFFLGGGDVENVVDDLECEAEGLAESGELAEKFWICSGRHGAKAEGTRDQGPGFCTMDFDQFFEGDPFFFRIQIEDLTGNQPEAARGMSEFGNEVGGGESPVWFRPSDGGKGLGQKPVPRQNGDGFPKDAVIGRASAPEIIIIHTGEIVMDEGIGVNAFDGAGGREGEGFGATSGPGCRQAEDGAEPFSSGKQAVPHGLVDQRGVGFCGNQPVQGFFHDGQAGFPIALGVHQTTI